MSRIGFITAMVDEAQTIASNLRLRPGEIIELEGGALLLISGLGGARAAAASRRLIARDVELLVSWGTAGGLAPDLKAGALVIPDQVGDLKGNRFRVDPGWHDKLTRRITLPFTVGLLLSLDTAANSVADKARNYALTRAVVIDMESAAIASTALAAGRPFVVVRAVVDGASTPLPAAATAAMDEDGQLRPARMMRALSRAPKELVQLAKLAPKFAAARASLRAAAAEIRGLS